MGESRLSNIFFFFLFNAAQPGVGRVQVLGSKKTEEEEELFLVVVSEDE